MLKRKFALLLVSMIVLAMVFSAGMAMAVTPVTATSAVTVNVASAISIAPTPIPAITLNAIPGQAVTSSTVSFTVNCNVAGQTYAAAVTTQPWTGAGMTANLLPVLLNIPGATIATLSATITAPFTQVAGAYNGVITVTVSPGL